MNPLRRLSLYLWLLLRHLPPVSPGRLLMPGVFIGSWTTFRMSGVSEPVAFVWAGVLAQATHLWAVLPVAVWRQRQAFGSAKSSVRWAVAFYLGTMAFQIWWCEPWMSQRLVSIYCAGYAAMMALGVWGDSDVLDRTVPVSKNTDMPLVFRCHLLMLYAFVAILVLATNETLLVIDATLSSRVVTISLLPIALHYFFHFGLLLTYPPLDKHND
ncbi:hypothetical protein ACXYMP_16065 [Aliiroseovarius sp. CAU 1755]